MENHGFSLNNMKRSTRKVTLLSKLLASSIAVVLLLSLACSFLFSVHIASSPHHSYEGSSYFLNFSKRNPLSITSNSPKARLGQIRKLVDDQQTLISAYASYARKVKLDSTKFVRVLVELSLNFTDIVKNPSYHDLLNNGNLVVDVVGLRQFEKDVKEQTRATKQVISQVKESFDCQMKVHKLKDTIFALNDQITMVKKGAELSKLAASTSIPKSLHCIGLRLMQERIDNPDKYVDSNEKDLFQLEFEDPELYHYAIFSDNVLAASVVVNSIVQNAKEPWKHVLHVVTDKTAFAAMQVMLKLKDHNGAHIEVKSVEDYKFLNSSYVPVLRQKESEGLHKFYFGNRLDNNATKAFDDLKFRNPKYLSILNHLRFYLPEMYPKLPKMLFLDDDVVVQRDLTDLWEIDLDGKVNGAVFTCFGSFHTYGEYFKFKNPLIKETLDPKACAWAFGMNIFDLDAWRRENCTGEYHKWQNLNEDRSLWKLGSLPPALITFYNTTMPIDKSWHILGLGYNPNIKMEDIQNAAVVHYNGNMKPWLDNAISKFRPIWTQYVDCDLEPVRACNFAL